MPFSRSVNIYILIYILTVKHVQIVYLFSCIDLQSSDVILISTVAIEIADFGCLVDGDVDAVVTQAH